MTNTALKIKELIKKGESETVEFKSSFNVETIETLVAFANSKGGMVLIGVTDKNKINGVIVNNESLQNWVNEVKNKTSPSIVPDAEIIEINNKQIVVLIMPEYPIKPVSTKGKYLKRIANSNHVLSTSEVVNMHLNTFNTSWDYHTNNHFKTDDISFEKVQLAIEIINQTGKKITDDPLTFLNKNDLIREEKLTNAGYLLFTKRDTVITTIELGRFQSEIIIKDTDRTKADILTQIEQVLDFVKKHINKEVIITGAARNIQKWQYPIEAIREIVLNMIVHRDYRSSSDSIVKVFDNKIEFYNPGRLPENITVEDLLSNNYKSTPRNKLIADFFKSLGLIEKYGSGIKRIVDYFIADNLPSPKFKNISDGFLVTVYSGKYFSSSENVTENVTENRINILIKLITDNPKITTTELSEKLNVTRMTIHRDLDDLKAIERIKRIGPDKGGYWEIKK